MLLPTWIWITFAAATMQTVRTGLQKSLKSHLPTHGINWIRFGFGLPFVALYVLILQQSGYEIPPIGVVFVAYCIAAGLLQIISTHLLITLFSHRNFAIGTTYVKTEVVQTAIIGAVIFGAYLNIGGIIAVIIGVIGVLSISFVDGKVTLLALLRNVRHPTSLMGLATGCGFAICALCIHEAAHSLPGSSLTINAALTLLTTLIIQTLLLGIWLLWRDKQVFCQIICHKNSAIMVGLTSALGSIGWFTVLALTEAVNVKIVGQIELLFAILVSHYVFKERIKKAEYWGMVLILCSVLLLIKTAA